MNSLLFASNPEINRREFLSLMAASMALAGVSGCSAVRPEHIVPYVRMPENILPGTPLYFATAMPSAGYGIGVVVESLEGRPIKVEGNPSHPASLGATDVFAQASLLSLYDPDRAQTLTNAGQISTWDACSTQLQLRLEALGSNGQALRILTETVTSPSITDLIMQVLARYPGAQWLQYEPVNRDNARAGARLAFGRYVDSHYRFADADVIVSLESDFMTWEPARLRYTREFARRRRVAPDAPGANNMNRLYVVESAPSITGANADHRFPLPAGAVGRVAHALASQAAIAEMPWLAAVAADLEAHPGRSLVIAGDSQPPEVHALVHTLNQRLGNVGTTVIYTDPVESQPSEQTDARCAALLKTFPRSGSKR
jgi:hypothetical protein